MERRAPHRSGKTGNHRGRKFGETPSVSFASLQELGAELLNRGISQDNHYILWSEPEKHPSREVFCCNLRCPWDLGLRLIRDCCDFPLCRENHVGYIRPVGGSGKRWSKAA